MKKNEIMQENKIRFLQIKFYINYNCYKLQLAIKERKKSRNKKTTIFYGRYKKKT